VPFEMTSLPAQVMAIEERRDQYQVVVQISTSLQLRDLKGPEALR
jgi:hypothetical protein